MVIKASIQLTCNVFQYYHVIKVCQDFLATYIYHSSVILFTACRRLRLNETRGRSHSLIHKNKNFSFLGTNASADVLETRKNVPKNALWRVLGTFCKNEASIPGSHPKNEAVTPSPGLINCYHFQRQALPSSPLRSQGRALFL